MIRIRLSGARPRPSAQTQAATGTDHDPIRPAPRGRGCETPEQRGGSAPDVSRPVRRGEPAPPHDPRDPEIERKIARLLEAGDEAEFVGSVFDRMVGALMELEDLLDVLKGDGRVGAEYRRALAAQLDHIQHAYLEEWKRELLESLDDDAG